MLPRPQVTRPLSTRRFRVPGPPARTLVSLDIVEWLRFPTNATFLVFNVVILGVVLITVRQADADAWFEVAALFLALASTVGVGSFGSTGAAHWIFNVSGRPRGWIAPKWMDSTIGIVLTHAVGLAAALTLYVAVARETSSRPLAGVT